MIISKLKKSRQYQISRGIGASDIFIAFVVMAILAVLFYNIFARYQEKKNAQATIDYMNNNASLALDSISKDLLYSTVYASGCKRAGIVKPKYGGISAPDELILLYASPFSTHRLKEDMDIENSSLIVKIGSPFKIEQKVAICDDTSIEWFTINQIGHKEEKGISVIFPELKEGASPFQKSYLAGSTIGPFIWVRYFIKKEEGKPSMLMRSEQDGEERPIAENIENLKVEYYVRDSDITLVEPFDPNSIIGIKITVVARSQREDSIALDGVNSLTGELDGYKRIQMPATIPFAPVDGSKIDDISYRIIKDKKTGLDIPYIAKNKNN